MTGRHRLLLILLLLCPSPLLAQEGRLEQVRKEAAVKDSSSQKASDSKPSDGRDDDNGFLGELFGPMILGAVAFPFVGPHALLEDDFGIDGFFARYPYADGRIGYLWTDQHEGEFASPETRPPPAARRTWAIRLSLEDGNDFRGLNRLGTQAVLDTTSRFGVRTNWNYLNESLGGGRSDETVLGDVNLTFRFAQNEIVRFYAGLGFRLMTDRQDTHFGFNFTYGIDVFPVKPLVLSSSFDVGSLGSAAVFNVRATAGVVHRGWEVFGGYDFLRIGSVNLQGPVAGLRLWF
jgi:hypothetical protein